MQVPFSYKLLWELSTLMEGNFGVYLVYPYESHKGKTTTTTYFIYLHTYQTSVKLCTLEAIHPSVFSPDLEEYYL